MSHSAHDVSILLLPAASVASADLAHWRESLHRAGALGADFAYLTTSGAHASLIHAVNAHAAASDKTYLWLLSDALDVQPDALPPLIRRLEEEPDLCGVGPVLRMPVVHAPGDPSCASHRGRVSHLGCVADSAGQLHNLYEGLLAGHPLAGVRRRFQVIRSDALLVRRADFLAVGGLRPGLDELSGIDYCLRAGTAKAAHDAGARAGFSCEPSSVAFMSDICDSLRYCALWNSLMQRGRLDPSLLRPDYHSHVRADKEYFAPDYTHEYGLVGAGLWLQEGLCPDPVAEPCAAEEAAAGGFPLRAFVRFVRKTEPATLLALLQALPVPLQAEFATLCRDAPSFLPRTESWYVARADALACFAHKARLPRLMAQVKARQATHGLFCKQVLRPSLRLLADSGLYACGLDNAPSVFDAWLELREAPAHVNAANKAEGTAVHTAEYKSESVETAVQWPDMAVIMPVWNPHPEFLRAALDSVLAQEYPRWQLCVADDASTQAAIPALLREYAARDARIRVLTRSENGHISHASNSALTLADAPWAAFMDHDDTLAPEALAQAARMALARPRVRMMYSDEDKIDSMGVRRTPFFRAGFDPYLHSTGHLSLYDVNILRAVNGLRPGFEGAQDFDLSLRVAEQLHAEQIAHIPHILYHWRIHKDSTSGALGSKPYVLEATRRALAERAQRQAWAAHPEPMGKNNFFTLRWEVPPGLRLSVIILEENGQTASPALWDCLAATACRVKADLEILRQPCGCPASTALCAEGAVRGLQSRLLPQAASLEAGCTAAAHAACGEVVFFLGADLAPMSKCLPEQVVALALQADVGMAGGCLAANGYIAHAGLYPDVTGLPFILQQNAALEFLPSLCWGHFLLTRRTLGASACCMAVRREVFLDGGGLDPTYGAWATAAYCLRQEEQGRHCLMSPWSWWDASACAPASAQGVTQDMAQSQAERFRQRFGAVVRAHPLRNPNLRAAPDHCWTLEL